MAAEIRTIKDGDTQVLPRTTAKAVKMEDGYSLEAALAKAKEHINDRSNPHGVTAADVGALPEQLGVAGQLLGFTAKNVVGAVDSWEGKYNKTIKARFPVRAGETIRAGDVVDVVGGEVGKTWGANGNTTVTQGYSPVNYISACVMNDATFLTAGFSGTDSGTGRVKVGTINGETVTVQPSDVNFFNGALDDIDIIRLAETKFVIVRKWSGGSYACPGTLDGTALTIGQSSKIAAGTDAKRGVCALSDDTFFFAYDTGGGVKTKVCTISGNAVTQGDESTLPGITGTDYISMIRLPDLNGSKRVCVCFNDKYNGRLGKAIIASIGTNKTITWGNVTTFSGDRTVYIDCCLDGNDIVVAFVAGVDNSTLTDYAKILTVTGTTITQSNSVCTVGVLPTDATRVQIEKVSGKFVVGYSRGSKGITAVLKRVGNGLEKETEFIFSNSSIDQLTMEKVSDSYIILTYLSNSNGTSTLLRVFGNRIAGSFTDISKQAIALRDGVGGQEIEVIFDGVAELPGAGAGREITSDGVYGYCPMDGLLWVRPEWSVNIVCGKFSSTATDETIAVTLGFKPRLVIIYSSNNNSMANGSGGESTSNSTPRIVTPLSGGITEDGFTHRIIYAATMFYVAFK